MDEILASPAFDGTRPFALEISDLMRRRDEAIAAGDRETRSEVERELVKRNPTYFGFLDLDERMEKLRGAG